MSRAIARTIAGRTFPSQQALEHEIRSRLAAQPLNELFQDDWLAAVINTCHPAVRDSGAWANGWFRRLDGDALREQGIWLVGPMLFAQFAPRLLWVDVPTRPWRPDVGRHTDLRAVLTRGERDNGEAQGAVAAP